MRAYQIGAQKGVESLTLSERPDLTPGPGQAVVKVRAACLNHRDLLIIGSNYGVSRSRPAERAPCSDGVGDVIAVGEAVSGVAVGDRVTCTHFSTWLAGPYSPSVFAGDLGVTQDGWLAEQILVPATALVKVPAAMSDELAATLPAAGVTTWNALHEVGKIKAGDLVLTLGAGGVSIFALQLAQLFGARVAITSSSDEKLARARAMGADITVNYRTTKDWGAAVMEASGGAGADIVVETGGTATLAQSIAAAAPNGRIVLIGGLGGGAAALPLNFSGIIGKNLTLKGITAGSRQMLVELMAAVQAGGIEPVIDRVFPFEQATQAYRHLQSGAHMGKVMIKVAG